jgi:hypothetical protein
VNTINILLSVGPGDIVRAWGCRSYEHFQDDFGFALYEEDLANALCKGYFSLPLENIWAARKMKPPKDDEPATKWILDTITCEPFLVLIITTLIAVYAGSKCATPRGLTPLTEASTHTLRFSRSSTQIRLP